jgi:hypothetical protein
VQILNPTPTLALPLRGCVLMEELAMVVILSEVKNLIISTESTIEILRLAPQNDITTQPLKGRAIVASCTRFLPFQGPVCVLRTGRGGQSLPRT